MTAEAGLVDVFVFGGAKSRLRSLAAPYAFGRAFVYLDPVKDFRKLSDFEVRDSFPGLRDELERIWSAGLVAELLIKTSGGGGDFHKVLALAVDTLTALDSAPHDRSAYPIVLFLWRLFSLLGLGPDLSVCVSCGSDRYPGETGAYSFAAEGFVCPNCGAKGGAKGGANDRARGSSRDAASGVLSLSAGALRWLERIRDLSYAEAMRFGVDSDSLGSLRDLTFGLARRAVDVPLSSFMRGAGLP
jgi:DNA repair protein RecO